MKNNNLKVMGIVGIRSGSKGVPDKNIKLLSGKPLVGWILEAAKKSKYINRLIVSTDSQKYADIATSFGADVPCLRPKNIANDNSQEFEYVKHMVEWLKKNEDYRPDIVVRMMATSPLQSFDDIDAVVEKLISEERADSAVVISEARQHPEKALKIIYDEEGVGKLVTYYSESGQEVTPIARQSYTPAYFRANVIACRTRVIFDTNSLTGDLVRFHIISQERAIDIDSDIDFYIAENLNSK
jgi:N-acylneuraminate cytidylyltransferase/CMP-N,N'-diacetyllegionaminic acid synthase